MKLKFNEEILKLLYIEIQNHTKNYVKNWDNNFPCIFQRQWICDCLGLADSNIFYENLKMRLAELAGDDAVLGLETLGLLNDKPVVKLGSPLDTLSHYLAKKLALGTMHYTT